MKKVILTAIAASIVASPFVATAASAAPYQEHRTDRETRVIRHQPGRTVVVTHKVRYEGAAKWRRHARAEYRHPHHVRVRYEHRAYG